jgi:acetoin utilization protein AcuB
MTRSPFTVRSDGSVGDARETMKRERIHRLPVADKKGHLVGIVTEKDILYASPSPASTLDVWEMNSLLSRLTVGEVMTSDPISVTPDVPIEQAARIMADNDIGGLPVVEKETLVGIITESDIFKVFIELFASRQKGLRVTCLIPEEPGELAKLAGAIYTAGGDILSFGNMRGENPTNSLAVIKVDGLSEEALVEAITPCVQEIRDIRKP